MDRIYGCRDNYTFTGSVILNITWKYYVTNTEKESTVKAGNRLSAIVNCDVPRMKELRFAGQVLFSEFTSGNTPMG